MNDQKGGGSKPTCHFHWDEFHYQRAVNRGTSGWFWPMPWLIIISGIWRMDMVVGYCEMVRNMASGIFNEPYQW